MADQSDSDEAHLPPLPQHPSQHANQPHGHRHQPSHTSHASHASQLSDISDILFNVHITSPPGSSPEPVDIFLTSPREPSSEAINNPVQPEEIQVAADGPIQHAEDLQDEAMGEDEAEAEGNQQAESSEEDDLPENIVTGTQQKWNSMRNSVGGAGKAYNITTFLAKWVENGNRRQQLLDALQDRRVASALRKKSYVVKKVTKEEEDHQAYYTSEIRREMKSLLVEPCFSKFEPYKDEDPKSISEACNTAWLESSLKSIWPTLKKKAPLLVAFSSQLLQNQFDTASEVQDIVADENNSAQIIMITSLYLRGYAQNTSVFLRQVLGLYMLANGTTRRVMDTLSAMGVVSSYTVLNQLLNNMAKRAKEVIKLVAHDPNGIIVYDNFNFKDRIRELAGGKKDEMVNLTTACLVACPELHGPLRQSQHRPTTKFTKEMLIKDILPQRKTVIQGSKWLMRKAIFTLFKKTVPEFPNIKRVTFKNSPYVQLGAIYENEGTISGTYRVHKEIWQERLEFDEYIDRIVLVYGDQKTTSLCRRVKQAQLESNDIWELRKWLIPVPVFFHIEVRYIDMLFRNFWDTSGPTRNGKKKGFSSATISADVQFFQRGHTIGKKDVKYHQVLPLLMHGYTARILAFIIQALVDKNLLEDDQLTIEGIQQAVEDIEELAFDDIFEDIWEKVLSTKAWYSQNNNDGVDVDFQNQCRLMQCIEVLLVFHEAVRLGDYGLIRDIIPMLPVLFWGGKSSNYGPEMLYFAWLLHPSVSDTALSEAILKGGFIRCTTSGSSYKAIDLFLEHINATYAIDIKNHKNSTHDLFTIFSRLALNGSYLAIIRKVVEKTFSTKAKGSHTAGNATADIISYGIKLYKDGITRKKVVNHVVNEETTFVVDDIRKLGAEIMINKLGEFNETIPTPMDAGDQQFMPSVFRNGPDQFTEEGWEDEGNRLFEVDEDDMWANGFMDLTGEMED